MHQPEAGDGVHAGRVVTAWRVREKVSLTGAGFRPGEVLLESSSALK
jgi:hypothetical protein